MFEWLNPIEMFERMSEWHPAIGSLYGIVGIIAIIVAGFWTALRYSRRREGIGKAVLEQVVEIFKISSTDKYLVRVKVTVINIGAVKIEPFESIIKIDRVFPTTDKELNELIDKRQDWNNDKNIIPSDDTFGWEQIGIRKHNLEDDEFILEPGEQNYIWSDFIISNEYEMIQVYSKVICGKEDPELRWDVVSFHKL